MKEFVTSRPTKELLSWKLRGNITVRNPFVLPCSTNRIAKDLAIINSSLVIGISLEILRNMRSLTSTPCIFKTIYTYANEIQTIQVEEDRQGKLMANYAFGNQRVRFQFNS